MFLVSAFARLEAFAEGEAQSMFLAAASPRRLRAILFLRWISSDYIFLTWIDG